MLQFLPALALVTVSAAGTSSTLSRSESVLVRGVIDGGTISVQNIGRVRLLGIVAPASTRNGDAAPFAREARDRLADLVLAHWVRLEADGDPHAPSTWRHAYVWREDGVFVNAVLVREGLARVAVRGAQIRLAELQRAEADARTWGRGVWSAHAKKQIEGQRRGSVESSRVGRYTPQSTTTVHSCQPFPSNTPPSGKSAIATSSTIALTTGRSGFSSS